MNPAFKVSRRQIFSLPNSIIYYIAKNPSSPKYGWKTCSGKSCSSRNSAKKIIFNKVDFKIWITDTVRIEPPKQTDNNIISSIISKIHRCEVKSFNIQNAEIYFDQLVYLTTNAECLSIYTTTILSRNGDKISLPNIIEFLPKIDNVFFYDATVFIITSNTVKELIKLPQFSKIWLFQLYNIPDSFDIDTFYDYIKKKKNTHFYLKFNETISEEYKNRLNIVIDELIKAQRGFLIPYITFPGLDEIKRKQLFERHMN
uniref:Uncharacterized protein n=1 Tax=Panagrolaimus sp. ES5 TaxID=591445 RepID=A0AC34GUU0_9BILA